jgi:hypothetical protein
MTAKVFALDTQAGVQRDGTVFDRTFYSDGRWVRFQRTRPRKILGYREIIANLAGPSRGIYVNPQNAFSYVYSGYNDGLQVLPINDNGVGSALENFTLSGFVPNVNNLWQFDSLFDAQGSGNELLVAHAGQNLSDVNSSVNTRVLGGDVAGTSLSPLGVFTATATTVNANTTITLSAANSLVGAGQTVTGAGIPANTTVVSVSTTSVVISNAATASATVTVTFDNNVSVSGGVVVLHPYVFVYGNNGLIKNSAAGDPNNWVSADSNETNAASTKVIQGLPVRGGSNAPSGLFWSLDSLIRVSFTPTTVTVSGTPQTFYWRYDIISSQSSILSSQCVIEYDGIYYWCGVDRFLLYNGVVKEIPNVFNQNYFFDNLNYAQRNKVYATKVPRFGEIWWFFPSGDSTECNDCIIYNIRENCWYDAGTALGARRSAGYFSQVFHYPINAGWETNATGGVNVTTISSAGSGYTNGTYLLTPLTGGTGTGATADIVVAGGVVTSVTIANRGTGYTVGDFLSATIPAGAGFVLTIVSTMNFVSLWQHEIGTDAIKGANVEAIESYFETSDLGFVAGGPSQPTMVGENKWIRVDRIEPDFIQSGDMTVQVTGRPFAQSEDVTSDPYTFSPNNGKVDMREQRRELRLRFVSNTQGGNYQMGRVIIDAEFGDTRPYGS